MSDRQNELLRLRELLTKLPEVYQPVYGHPEFDPMVSRKGEGRIGEIKPVVAALQRTLGRPARVIDLGCAQGWMSLHLAEAGATVFGIDHFEPNVAVCNALAAENLGLNVRFQRADIESLAERLKAGDFDLLLGLSVFHHLCARFGMERVRALLGEYLQKVPNLILELAINTEAPSWAKSLPDDPAYFVEDMPFATVLSHHATHLKSTRPLYFCSRAFDLRDGEMRELPAAP